MANNYFDATGVLVLNRVTPVIRALFSGFKLDESYPGDGEAYIARISEDGDPQWADILDKLVQLAGDLGVPIPATDDPPMERCLVALAGYFRVEEDEALDHLIEHHAFDDTPDLEALFLIATRFEDGHGLSAIRLEASWYCSKPRLFEFGGQGLFLSREFTHRCESSQGWELGQAVHSSLVAGDFDAVAALLARKMTELLNGISGATARTTVRQKLAQRLQDSSELFGQN